MPPTTLHVVTATDPSRDGASPGEIVCAAAANAASPGDRVLVVGTSAQRDTAAALGVNDPWLTTSRARPRSAVIRRAARAAGAGRVLLWNRELLPVAPRVRRGLAVEACLFDLPPDDADENTTPIRFRPEAIDRLVVPDEHAASAWKRAGAAPDAVQVRPIPAPLPAERAPARAVLGVGDRILLVPLIAEPREVDARAVVFVSGVLELLGLPHALVLPGRAKRLAEAMRFRHRTMLQTPLLLVDPPFANVLPAADVFIAPHWGAARSPVQSMLESHADRLGVPVAPITGWEPAAGLPGGMYAPELRENVRPLVDAWHTAAARTGEQV
ncbi:MAG TPA: hypothetical protein ENK11_00650 [Phycisphaerales bacterium]|nr:hypothetical protein [Phycisphaerales bacterium]